MKRTGLLFTTLGIIIFVLLVIQISVSNMLSTGGIALDGLQQKIQDTKKSNAMLKEEVLTKSSLASIAQKAEEQGFTLDKNVAVVVSRDVPLALKQ